MANKKHVTWVGDRLNKWHSYGGRVIRLKDGPWQARVQMGITEDKPNAPARPIYAYIGEGDSRANALRQAALWLDAIGK